MKRRLNILCIIVVLVLGYSVLETGYYFIVGVKAGGRSRHRKRCFCRKQERTDKYEVYQSAAGAPFQSR